LPAAENATSRVWEGAFLALLFLLCCMTRLLELGYKAIMHDEALFVYYTWDQLYNKWAYGYLPILHGPAMLHLQSLTFHIFGVTDFTMRLGCALLGIAGFWWVYALRPWLRTAGTYFALAFYTFSPGITYYQRFFRNDALYLFNSLWIVVSLAYWWRTRNPRWLASGIIGCAVLFTNKESSLFVYFTLVTFGVLLIVHDLMGELFAPEKCVRPVEREALPRVPNPAWGVLLAGMAVVLVITQVFEGLRYDDDVVRAIGHDWVLKDVRSIPKALSWQGSTPAEDIGALAFSEFWIKFYVGLFTGLLVLFVALRFVVHQRWGCRQFLPHLWMRLHEGRYYLLGALATATIIYLTVFTTLFKHPTGFFEIYAKTWSYWGGQHEWGRIGGPFHQHMLNILVYETPALILLLIAWIGGLFRERWDRLGAVAFVLMLIPVAAFHKLLFSGLEFDGGALAGIDFLKTIFMFGVLAALLVLCFPRFGRPVFILSFVALLIYSVVYLTSQEWSQALVTRIYKDAEPVRLAGRHVNLRDMMEIQYNFDGGGSLLIVLVLIFFATAYSWLALGRGERFHAFLVWWFVTALGAASYAREAVPQVGIHAMLPLILLAGSYFGRWWPRFAPGLPRNAALAAVVLLAIWNFKTTMQLNFQYPDDPRERMVYGPIPQDLKNHCKFVEDYARIAPLRMGPNNVPAWITQNNDFTKHKDLRIGVQADGAVWAVRWYLRDLEWREEKNIDKMVADNYDFIFVDVGKAETPALKEKYHLFRGSGIRFWLPVPLKSERLLGVWKAWIPGHYLDGTQQAVPAQDALKEWRKLFRYMTRRETFNGGMDGSGNIQSTDYVFGVRKDLY
jgi:predicted membrane-bound mannosyltransferase